MSKLIQWSAGFALFVMSVYVAASGPAPVAVTTVVKQSVLQEVVLTGTVTSANVAQLSVSTAGLIAALMVEEGNFVNAGDALLVLDNELVTLQLQSSEAAVEEASVALNDAQRRLDEARKLAKQKNIAVTAVKDRETEVASNEAGLHKAQAAAAYQKALLDRHTLRAPFSGVIAERLVNRGEWVAPGSGVFNLVDLNNLRLDFSVAETHLNKISENAAVRFTLAGAPDKFYEGRVNTVVPVTDPNSRTFLLRVRVADGQLESAGKSFVGTLLPGMSVQARLAVPAGTSGLVVPRDALLRYPDGRTVVWQVEQDNGVDIVKEGPVALGASFNGFVEILSGLDLGATVVVRGNETLRHGQAVTVVAD